MQFNFWQIGHFLDGLLCRLGKSQAIINTADTALEFRN